MRDTFHFLWVFLLSSTAGNAGAVELNYLWKPGEVQRFKYQSDDHFTPSPPSGSASGGVLLSVRSTFSEKVLAARPDGTADLELTLEELEVSAGGERARVIHRLPQKSRVLQGTVDRKGRLSLPRMVTVDWRAGRIEVGLRDVGRESGAGSSGAKRKETSADHRTSTGTVSVDALPSRLFALAVLPDGDQEPRKAVDLPLSMPLASGARARALRWTLFALDGNVATVDVVSAAAAGAASERGRRHAQPLAPINVEVRSRYDLAAGRLLDARGTIITRQGDKVSSRVVLERL